MNPETNGHNIVEKVGAKFIRYALIIGIAILFVLFANLVAQAVSPEPKYEDFCPNTMRPAKIVETQESCVADGGIWDGNYCDMYRACSAAYQSAQEGYDNNTSTIFLGMSVLLLVLGTVFVNRNNLYSSIFVLSGVILLLVTMMRFWSAMHNILQLILVGISLLALLYLAQKRLKE